jgi:hypothetical protein
MKRKNLGVSMMNLNTQNRECHSERSEESARA